MIGGGLGGLGGRVHARRPRPRRAPSLKPTPARRQGGLLHGAGFVSTWDRRSSPLPASCARVFEKPAARLSDYLALDPPRPAVALLLRRWHHARPPCRRRAHEADARVLLRSARRRPGYATFIDSPPGSTTSASSSSSGGPIGGVHDMMDPGSSSTSRRSKTSLAMRMGQIVAGTIRRTRARPARRADDRPLHAVRRLLPVRVAGRAVRHRTHADPRRRVVSDGRHARLPRGTGTAGAELGVELVTGTRGRAIIESDGRRAASGCAAAARRGSTPSSATWTPSERTRLLGGAAASASRGTAGYEPACSGVVLYLGLRKRYDHLLHHDFVFSRIPRRSSTRSTTKAGRPRPDLLHRSAGRHRPDVAPPGGEALYVSSTRRTCGRTTTGRRCSRRTGR